MFVNGRSVVASLSLMVALTGCGGAEPEAAAPDALAATEAASRGRAVTGRVMTRNLYLGADLGGVVAAQSLPEFLAATTEVWTTVVANDFHHRAELVADEIAHAKPVAVGLQEAYLWRTQLPSDPATPATHVEYDYVAELLAALEARGAHYVVGVSLDLFDFEAPTLLGLDARLTDRQVILVRADVSFENPRAAPFSVLLPLNVLGTPVQVARGWTAVDLVAGDRSVAFFNTHTESFYAPVRVAQGMELAAILAATPGDAILVGDLNSLPGTEAAASVAAAGFTDAWAALHPKKPGYTCCWPEALSETAPGLDERIDYVFVRGLKPLAATVIGDEPRDHRTGLWPSDHAGLVVMLKDGR